MDLATELVRRLKKVKKSIRSNQRLLNEDGFKNLFNTAESESTDQHDKGGDLEEIKQEEEDDIELEDMFGERDVDEREMMEAAEVFYTRLRLGRKYEDSKVNMLDRKIGQRDIEVGKYTKLRQMGKKDPVIAQTDFKWPAYKFNFF